MSLGNDLTPVVREETILNGGDITPATRLEWFLAKAAEGGGGGGGGTVYSPVLAQTTKSVASHWVSSFAGGPILENANYRVIVNGTTYEPLTGTAGEDGHICLGNTYVADSDPSGDYSFGIFYKNSQLSAWLETGDSMTMQIDQIIQAVPVPTPAAADTGKVLTANNGAVEWAASENPIIFLHDNGGIVDADNTPVSFNNVKNWMAEGHLVVLRAGVEEDISYTYAARLYVDNGTYCIEFMTGYSGSYDYILTIASTANEQLLRD